MKKLSIMMFVAMIAGYLSAAPVSWDWTVDAFQTIDVAFGSPSTGEGAGWYIEVVGGNTTGGNTTSTIGWYGAYYLGSSFNFNANEGAGVNLVLWNSATPGTGYYIESSSVALPTGLSNPPTSDISFNFTGQTWQAVPEPATFMMFAMGGIGAWLLRRRNTN